jgi:hypothetical protein
MSWSVECPLCAKSGRRCSIMPDAAAFCYCACRANASMAAPRLPITRTLSVPHLKSRAISSAAPRASSLESLLAARSILAIRHTGSGLEAHHHQQPSAARPPCGIDIVVIVKKPADNQGIRSAVRAATPFDPVVIAIEGTIRVACRRFFFWPVS